MPHAEITCNSGLQIILSPALLTPRGTVASLLANGNTASNATYVVNS